jgi:pimeloyl-ACP methyl ester carboxylesterase
MWTARALMNSGEDRSLLLSSIERRHASMRELIDPARGLIEEVGVAVPWHLLDAAIDLGPSPWADPIPLWASDVSASDNEFAIRRFRDNQGNLVLESEAHGIQVWHEATAVVIPVPPGAVQIGIEYEWDRWIPVPHFVEYDPNAEGELLPTLDGRLYAGEKSVILETDNQPAMWSVPPEMLLDRQARFRWLFRVTDRAGLFIGRIARRLIRRPSPIIHDPGFLARLTDEEARLGTPNTLPRIEEINGGADPLAVVVHGTFSCSVEIASRIRELCPQLCVARFEHDTFLPVSANVKELVSHLTRLAQAGQTQLVLIAHSRGGLVACQAASIAGGLCPSLKLRVCTFGTPHSGTPLAGAGGVAAQSLGALYRLCARPRDGAFRATFVEGAAAYLASVGQLPPGVAVMREGSDFLDLHRLYAQQLNLRTWGARCNTIADGGTGHSLLLAPAIGEIFDQRSNDLVVPTASAILDNSQPIPDCNHFQYFAQPGLRAALADC